ncbi:MAG: hypothetical protein DMG07_08055, partial [Acidobacteria bacterium]
MLWMASASLEHRRFRGATGRVAETQASVLREILRSSRATEFGRRLGFSSIRTTRDFQRRVPLSTYDDYRSAVARIADGEPHVLTSERVELFEPTSGTTGGEKWIPYTRGLRRQFQAAIRAWIFDLLHERPALRAGRAYWSVSPAFGETRRTPGGIPVGFDADTAYLASFERRLVGRLLAVPPEVARSRDLDRFRYTTLVWLLAAEDLALVSVWSPSFLVALLSRLEEWSGPLCRDLAPRAPKRAEALRRLLESGASLGEKVARVWPSLRLISAWTDGAAAQCVPGLRAIFPEVEIQPKGLVATEGCVSFPLVGGAGAALALRSHFFEFQDVGGGDCLLAHELEAGGRYRVVITTAGGLYRYELRDEVKVIGFDRECPLLRFVGKADRVGDLVGEKLAEGHVARV